MYLLEMMALRISYSKKKYGGSLSNIPYSKDKVSVISLTKKKCEYSSTYRKVASSRRVYYSILNFLAKGHST